MRIFLGFLIAAAALGVSAYLYADAKLHSYRVDEGITTICAKAGTQISLPPNSSCPSGYTHSSSFGPTDYLGHKHGKASWQNALAVFIAVAGIGVGAGIALRR